MVFLRVFVYAAILAVSATTVGFWDSMDECALSCIETVANKFELCDGVNNIKCMCINRQYIQKEAAPCLKKTCVDPEKNSVGKITHRVTQKYMTLCSDFQQGHENGLEPDAISITVPPIIYTAALIAEVIATSATTIATAPEPSKTQDYSGSVSSFNSGAMTGIAVGAGIGGIFITGLLVLVAIRLVTRSWRHSRIMQPEQDHECKVENETRVCMRDKPQLDGTPIAELQTRHTLSGFETTGELETREKPAELSANPDREISQAESEPRHVYD
ncbi:hypothetical protein F5B20DRAFT_31960 [Whalleya microplaca]|nr:hypothetical protein F5B20DRAFT_31960 [Whalleya microplaca]